MLAAKDFSYFSTGLPHYASSVQGVASGVVADTLRQKKISQAVIFTNDPFDSVVTWYKSQVPAGMARAVHGRPGRGREGDAPQWNIGMLFRRLQRQAGGPSGKRRQP